MLPGEAVVVTVLRQGQEWRVRYQATYWHARAIRVNAKFQPHDRVEVVGRQGLVLLIKPVSAQDLSALYAG